MSRLFRSHILFVGNHTKTIVINICEFNNSHILIQIYSIVSGSNRLKTQTAGDNQQQKIQSGFKKSQSDGRIFKSTARNALSNEAYLLLLISKWEMKNIEAAMYMSVNASSMSFPPPIRQKLAGIR